MVTTTKKVSAKKTPAKRSAAAAKKTAAPAASKLPGVQPGPGPVERSTARDLERLGLTADPLAASALALARHVDQADSPSGAAAAAREMRMTLAEAKAVVKPARPAPAGDSDGVVTPPSRLTQLRKKRREPRAAKS